MSDLYVGLISGTSIDAIDAAIADLGPSPSVVATHSHPIPSDIRERLLALIDQPVKAGLRQVGRLETQFGRLLGEAANAVIAQAGVARERIRAIGSHGQTIWHEPEGEVPFTWQIGDPNLIAVATGITTVADFRRRDLAHGGQGAPLAPAFHEAVFASPDVFRVVLNIGGFSNLTLLKPGALTTGFDSGPGNVLMDAWIHRHQGRLFDDAGEWAASGTAIPALLEALLRNPYFAAAPPKSTGRELFHLPWIDGEINNLTNAPRLNDVQATLCELTATTIADSVHRYAGGCQEIYVCGGGHRNRALLDAIARHLPGVRIDTTAALGIEPDWIEAALFAWLAKQTLEGRAVELPSITGSRQADVLGAIYRVAETLP